MVSIYDVLKASKGIHVEDSFAEIWGRKLRGGYEIKTLTGVPPFTFTADGEPLIDWSITGQTVQGGTPTPTNPVAVEGVGEKTENLIDSDTVYSAYKQADGTYQGTVNNFYTLHPTPFTADDIGKEFTFAIKVNATTSGNVRASAHVGDTNINGNNLSAPGITKVTFTVSSTNDYLYLGYGSGGGNQINISDIMLNAGSTARPYEPYGVKIPITCGGTTTNIYLGSATSTRRIKKLVLTGTENWASYTSIADCYRLSIANARGVTGQGICSHYALVETTSDLVDGTFVSGQNYSYFKDVASQNLEGWKAFLAQQYANGTPVTVCYALATEETGIVNEPLMKIGSYADEITKTGTGVNIPTTNGSNTLTVGTTVQPSEMSITFRGR